MRKWIMCLLCAAFAFFSNASAEDWYINDLPLPFTPEGSGEQAIAYMKDQLDELRNEGYLGNDSFYTYYSKENFDYFYEHGIIRPKDSYWEVYAFENNAPYSFWKAEVAADGEIQKAPWYNGTEYSPAVSDLEAVAHAFDYLRNPISAFLTDSTNASRTEWNEEKIELNCRDFYLGLEAETINSWCDGKRCIPVLFLCQDNHGNECVTPWWYVVIERLDNLDWSIGFFHDNVDQDHELTADRTSLYSFDYNWFPKKDQLVFHVQISSKTGEVLSRSE